MGLGPHENEVTAAGDRFLAGVSGLGERFENGLRHRGEFAENGYRVSTVTSDLEPLGLLKNSDRAACSSPTAQPGAGS
jgi:hypothetical protein